MSIKFMAAAWRIYLKPSEKLVLLALCDNSSDEGFCWPSVKTICKKTGLSERSVRDQFKLLEDKNLISRDSRIGQSNHFWITNPSEWSHMPPESDAAPPCTVFIPPLRQMQPPPAPVADITINEPSMNRNIIYSDEFIEFWTQFPKQRIGSKPDAWRKWNQTLKKNEVTENDLIAICLAYGQSDEVQRGYAKGCAAWLNDERWRNDYRVTAKSSVATKPDYFKDTVLNAVKYATREQ